MTTVEPYAAAFINQATVAVVKHSLSVTKGKVVSGTMSRMYIPDAANTVFGSYKSYYPVEIWISGATDGTAERMLKSLPASTTGGTIPPFDVVPLPGEGLQVRTQVAAGNPVTVLLKVIPMAYSV